MFILNCDKSNLTANSHALEEAACLSSVISTHLIKQITYHKSFINVKLPESTKNLNTTDTYEKNLSKLRLRAVINNIQHL